MLQAVLFVIISLGGSYASLFDTCEVTRCYSLAPVDAIDINDPNKLFPSVERLETICPGLRAAFDCLLEEFTKCTNLSMSEFLVTEHEGIDEVFLGTKYLAEDLCRPTTPEHQAYARNIECIRGAIMEPLVLHRCNSEAQSLYGAYKAGKEESEDDKGCMVGAHLGACVSGAVYDSCGEEARATFVDLLLKRTKILKYGVCTPQYILDLKTKYLDHLNMESSRRSLFEKVFDMRKRK